MNKEISNIFKKAGMLSLTKLGEMIEKRPFDSPLYNGLIKLSKEIGDKAKNASVFEYKDRYSVKVSFIDPSAVLHLISFDVDKITGESKKSYEFKTDTYKEWREKTIKNNPNIFHQYIAQTQQSTD